MGDRGRVIVIGSINVDITLSCTSLPAPGETVLAIREGRGFGGKGANQASAAAEAGAEVHMIGAVGADPDGDVVLSDLVRRGIRTDRVAVVPEQPTGRAFIVVADGGENSIIVSLGANATLDGDSVALSLETLLVEPHDVVLVSAEVSEGCARAAGKVAKATGSTFVYNVAPFRPLSDWVAECRPVLVLNEIEAQQASGLSVDDGAATALADICRAVVVTRGPRGAVLAFGRELRELAGKTAVVVDTTGAGDAFCGALAAALADGLDLPDAVERGIDAGTRAVTVRGARASADES
jgi:ribokinase